jgi:hypothetical protein
MNDRLREGIKIISATALVFTVGACDAIQTTQNPSPNPTALTSPFENPLPSQTAYRTQIAETAAPRPVGFVTEEDGTIVWYGNNGEYLITPKIPGLTEEIKGETLIYVASKGNPYKLPANETPVARFKPDVIVAGVLVGAVIVDGPIAAATMKSEPNTFPIPVTPDGPLTIFPSKLHLSTADYDGLTVIWEREALAENPFLNNNQGVYCSVQPPRENSAWSFFAVGGFSASHAPSSTSAADNLYFYGPTPAETTTDTVTKAKAAVGAPLMIIESPMNVISGTIFEPQAVGIENISTIGDSNTLELLGTP